MSTRRAVPAVEPSDPDRSAMESEAGSDAPPTPFRDRVDLSGLSIVGISRRRVGFVLGGVVAAWIVVAFARQVGDANAAAGRAAQLAADNAALAAEVQALEVEADRIVQPDYVAIAASGYQLGDPHDIPFTLSPSVPAPVDGAPGSASVRLGASTEHQTPLESWLSLLFGPAG